MTAQYLQTLQTALPALKAKYPIASMALFGSVTREDFDPERSDVDILVDYQANDFAVYLSLAEELEQLLGKKVDLITTRSLKPRQWEYLKNKLIYV
jgi:predicted nucleotidyltransferase